MIRLLAVTSLLGMCMTGCYVVGPWCNGVVGLSVIARSAGGLLVRFASWVRRLVRLSVGPAWGRCFLCPV